MAEHLDWSGKRGGGGGHGNDERRRWLRSALGERARESEAGRERERQGGPGGSVASQMESRATRGQPGRQLPAWHAAAPWLSSPLPSGRRKRTPVPSVGWPAGWAASWAGQISGLGKPGGVLSLHFYFISLFYFVILFWALLKIPRQIQKSYNFSMPLFGI